MSIFEKLFHPNNIHNTEQVPLCQTRGGLGPKTSNRGDSLWNTWSR